MFKILKKTKDQQKAKARGWVMVFLDEIRKIGANIGMNWMRVDRKRLWPRRNSRELDKIEESPTSSEEREANVRVLNERLGTWGSLNRSEDV